MSIKQDFFIAVKGQLTKGIKAFSGQDNASKAKIGILLYNRQDLDPENHKPLPQRFILLEFGTIDWLPANRGTQKGDALITFHIGYNAINNEKVDESGMFDFIEEVHAAISGFAGECFTPLQRVTERQDEDFDHVLIWEADYSTQLTDNSGRDTKKLVSSTVADVDVQGDLDIDNDIIRTGKPQLT